jgi:hypothetical protein
MRWWLGIALVCMLGGPARANNGACWGDGSDEPGRPDISCTQLTEQLLVSLEGATLVQVVEAMNAPGLPDDGGVLHFVSNYALRERGGVGVVDFRFGTDRRVEAINALVEGQHGQRATRFVWNVVEAGCSDFPGSIQRCDNREGAARHFEPSPPPPVEQRGALDWLHKWLGT